MDGKTLSYIVTTKNKLPFLQTRLRSLIAHKRDDEEILVADGASTDGTKDFLAGLMREESIDGMLSGPDYGESHALNKLLFMSKGELIKVITDDDIFHYPTLERAKQFMLEHPEIDVLGTNGGFKNQYAEDPVRALDYDDDYRKWLENRTPFSFCGLGIFLRRSSLPLTGLWNPSFRRADAEFALRVTAGKANVAWCTGFSFVNVSNPQSVSLVYQKKIKNETERLEKFYLDRDPESFLREFAKKVRTKLRYRAKQQPAPNDYEKNWHGLVSATDRWLEEVNAKKPAEFLTRPV